MDKGEIMNSLLGLLSTFSIIENGSYLDMQNIYEGEEEDGEAVDRI